MPKSNDRHPPMSNLAALRKPALADPFPCGTEDASCLLDLVHLSRQTMGEPALESELLELFDRQAANALDRLAGPFGKRAEIAHMLKGSARAVGAFAVADAAERLEHAIRAGAEMEARQADLMAALGATRRALAALLA